AAIFSGPFFCSRSRAIEDCELVTSTFCKVTSHRIAHDTKTYERNSRHSSSSFDRTGTAVGPTAGGTHTAPLQSGNLILLRWSRRCYRFAFFNDVCRQYSGCRGTRGSGVVDGSRRNMKRFPWTQCDLRLSVLRDHHSSFQDVRNFVTRMSVSARRSTRLKF